MPESRCPDRPDPERGSDLRSRTKRRGAESRPDESTGVLCANLREPGPGEVSALQIRTHIGVSLDGFVATSDGRSALLSMPDFVPGQSHGHPEFIEGCDAVLVGRTTFEPALGAPSWPWPGKRVYVLTSRPLPAETPTEGIVAGADPTELLEQMRGAGRDSNVHLVGGPQTIQAFAALGALERLGIVLLPILLGEGLPLSAPGTPPLPLRLETQRSFPDESVGLAYSFTS